MYALATVILGFLADALKGIVGRVLVALGLGVVTATGFNALFASALQLMTFQGSPIFISTIEAVGVPWFISTMLSAVTTRMMVRGLKSDSFSFWRMRRSIS
jgi:hypothetical protein